MKSAYLIKRFSEPVFIVTILNKSKRKELIEENDPDFQLMLNKLEELAEKDYKEAGFYRKWSYKDYRKNIEWSYEKLPAV